MKKWRSGRLGLLLSHLWLSQRNYPIHRQLPQLSLHFFWPILNLERQEILVPLVSNKQHGRHAKTWSGSWSSNWMCTLLGLWFNYTDKFGYIQLDPASSNNCQLWTKYSDEFGHSQLAVAPWLDTWCASRFAILCWTIVLDLKEYD